MLGCCEAANPPARSLPCRGAGPRAGLGAQCGPRTRRRWEPPHPPAAGVAAPAGRSGSCSPAPPGVWARKCGRGEGLRAGRNSRGCVCGGGRGPKSISHQRLKTALKGLHQGRSTDEQVPEPFQIGFQYLGSCCQPPNLALSTTTPSAHLVRCVLQSILLDQRLQLLTQPCTQLQKTMRISQRQCVLVITLQLLSQAPSELPILFTPSFPSRKQADCMWPLIACPLPIPHSAPLLPLKCAPWPPCLTPSPLAPSPESSCSLSSSSSSLVSSLSPSCARHLTLGLSRVEPRNLQCVNQVWAAQTSVHEQYAGGCRWLGWGGPPISARG